MDRCLSLAAIQASNAIGGEAGLSEEMLDQAEHSLQSQGTFGGFTAVENSAKGHIFASQDMLDVVVKSAELSYNIVIVMETAEVRPAGKDGVDFSAFNSSTSNEITIVRSKSEGGWKYSLYLTKPDTDKIETLWASVGPGLSVTVNNESDSEETGPRMPSSKSKRQLVSDQTYVLPDCPAEGMNVVPNFAKDLNPYTTGCVEEWRQQEGHASEPFFGLLNQQFASTDALNSLRIQSALGIAGVLKMDSSVMVILPPYVTNTVTKQLCQVKQQHEVPAVISVISLLLQTNPMLATPRYYPRGEFKLWNSISFSEEPCNEWPPIVAAPVNHGNVHWTGLIAVGMDRFRKRTTAGEGLRRERVTVLHLDSMHQSTARANLTTDPTTDLIARKLVHTCVLHQKMFTGCLDDIEVRVDVIEVFVGTQASSKNNCLFHMMGSFRRLQEKGAAEQLLAILSKNDSGGDQGQQLSKLLSVKPADAQKMRENLLKSLWPENLKKTADTGGMSTRKGSKKPKNN